MNQSVYFIFFGLLSLVNSSAVDSQPHDLFDEAKAQVDELRGIVQAGIVISLDVITNVARDLYFYRDKSNSAARTAFRQEYQTLLGQLTTLADLGESAGVDVSSCTTPHERPLYYLTTYLEHSLLDCYKWASTELLLIENDSKYFVDTIMTEVEVLNYQLGLCKGELSCISSILTKIETAIIELPQKIERETNKSKDLADNLKLLIDQCSAQGVAEMVADGSAMIAEAKDCVEGMLP